VRYHPRFDSNAWVWPSRSMSYEIYHDNILLMDDIFGNYKFDTSDTADPWFVVYPDMRGGISAATWVIDDADNGIYAFYNTRLIDRYDNTPLEDLMDPTSEGLPYSPHFDDGWKWRDLWTTLTSVVSPSYESQKDIGQLLQQDLQTDIPALIYLASHIIPHSINKLQIGG